MLGANRYIFVLLFLNIVPIPFASGRSLIGDFQLKFQEQTNSFNKLKLSLKNLENKIIQTQGFHLQYLEKEQELQKSIILQKKQIEENEYKIKGMVLLIQKVLARSYVINAEKFSSGELLLEQFCSSEILRKNLTTIQKRIEIQKKIIEESLQSFEELKFLAHREKQLQDLIKSLRIEKNMLAHSLSQEQIEFKNKIKEDLKTKYDNKSDQSLILSLGKLVLPLKNYKLLKNDKKGVTFQFDQDQPLYAIANGKIAYVGVLSTYGNIIMIDHGRDLRSVYLGNMRPNVTQNLEVKKGTLIGNAILENLVPGTIYLEIRKKNDVQDTILWFDGKLLAKNH